MWLDASGALAARYPRQGAGMTEVGRGYDGGGRAGMTEKEVSGRHGGGRRRRKEDGKRP